MLAANQPWRSQAKGSVDIAGGLGISATGRRPVPLRDIHEPSTTDDTATSHQAQS